MKYLKWINIESKTFQNIKNETKIIFRVKLVS